MGDRADITLDGITNIGGKLHRNYCAYVLRLAAVCLLFTGSNDTGAMPDFVDLIGLQNHVDDPEQDWPIDRVGFVEREASGNKPAKKKLKTSKEEMLDRVDKLLSSNTEAMKTSNKMVVN